MIIHANPTLRARTARIAHACENCHWNPSMRGTTTIAPGHRYLLHTAFPGGEVDCDAPYSLKECVACAAERGEQHHAGACLSWCCGNIPCARPERHDGDHSCRRCALDSTPAAGPICRSCAEGHHLGCTWDEQTPPDRCRCGCPPVVEVARTEGRGTA